MYFQFEQIHDLIAEVQRLNSDLESNEYLLLLLASDHVGDAKFLADSLSKSNVRFFGGVFESVISGADYFSSGCIIKKVSLLSPPALIPLPSDNVSLDVLPDAQKLDAENSTCFVLFDGQSVLNNRFLDDLYDRYGSQCNYFGGGAGVETGSMTPVIFGEWGIDYSAALVAVVRGNSRCVAQHGWKRCTTSMMATWSEGSYLNELNWEPASGLIDSVLEGSDILASGKEEYSIGVEYPGEADIIRDPIGITDDGAVEFLSSIPEGSIVYVVKGERQNLIHAASSAAKQIPPSFEGETLICDCVSRVGFLKEKMIEELNSVAEILQSEHPIEGVIAYGEIASDGRRPIKLFNKTIGICRFEGK